MKLEVYPQLQLVGVSRAFEQFDNLLLVSSFVWFLKHTRQKSLCKYFLEYRKGKQCQKIEDDSSRLLFNSMCSHVGDNLRNDFVVIFSLKCIKAQSQGFLVFKCFSHSMQGKTSFSYNATYTCSYQTLWQKSCM